MATTYIAKYSDNTTQTRIQAGCFGFLAVRRSAVNPDTRKMTELVFKPFYEYHLAALLYRDQVKVLQTTTIYWWKFLLKQPYIKDVLVEVPKLTAKTKIDKVTFKVRTEIPADRALAVLYLLRAPQYATGTVLAFTYMTRRLSIKPATAFVLALGINFQAATGDTQMNREWLGPQSKSEKYWNNPRIDISLYYSGDYSLVDNGKFTLGHAVFIARNLFGKKYNKLAFKGKQATLYTLGGYHKTGDYRTASTGTLMRNKAVFPGSLNNMSLWIASAMLGRRANRNDIHEMRGSARTVTPEKMKELATELELLIEGEA